MTSPDLTPRTPGEPQLGPVPRTLAAAALALLAVLFGSRALERPAVAVGLSMAATPSRQYLDLSTERSVRLLLGLSAAKTGLAVIEGSTADVSLFFFGASVQLGDVVKAIYDAVDYAWTAALFGCAALFALRQALEAGFYVGQYTFALALLSAALAMAAGSGLGARPAIRSLTERLTRFGLAATLILWIAFPLSLFLAGVASSAVTAPALQQAEEEVTSLQRIARPPQASPRGISQSIESVRTYLVTKTDDLTRALGTIIAGYVLDCVVFPAAFAYLLIGFAKRSVGLG